MIVMAQPLEVVERSHFEVGTRQRRGEFFANRTQNAHAGEFVRALGQQFFGSRRPFLGAWFVRIAVWDSEIASTHPPTAS